MLTIEHKAGALLPLALYLLPSSGDPTGLTLTVGEQSATVSAPSDKAELVRIKVEKAKLTISRDVVPVPSGEQKIYGVEGVESALRALGYIE